jgi:MFS family permease
MFLNEHERPTRAHYMILVMSWAGWMFDFYDLLLLSFLLVPIKQELGFSRDELSLLLGISLAATAIGGVAFGYLADRFGRKRVLSWTILTYSIGTFLCGLAPNLPWLLVFRVVTGLGVGGEWATGQTLIGETFPAKMRARYAAYMQTGAPLGIALAALVGGFFVPRFGWRAAFFVSVLPALLVVLIRRKMPESDLWEARQRAAAGHPAAHERSHFGELLIEPDLRGKFLKGFVLALTDMSAYWFTYTWLPTYLYEQLGFSLARSGLWMLVTQVGGFCGYVSFGFIADWRGRRKAYTLFSVIWAVGLLLITWFWGWIAAAYQWLTLLCMFLVGYGTGNFSGYGPIFSEIFPTRIRNTAMGSAFNVARGVQFFTPLIITWVARSYGLAGGISLAAFFALFTGAWVWTLPETKGRRIVA